MTFWDFAAQHASGFNQTFQMGMLIGFMVFLVWVFLVRPF